MMIKRGSHAGFSLVEALISLALGSVFLTSVMSAWVFTARTWKEETVRSRLRYQIEKAMERLKEDVRLSDGNGILFYPANAATYTAVSLPHATPNTTGFLTIGLTGITWDSTIIYHVYDNSGVMELRRTVFSSYNSSSSARQSQLNNVVLNGDDGNATTTVLFGTNNADLQITSTSPTFDGYAASTQLATASFGSIRLSAGSHEIRFEVVGKNTLSSGYRMGLDSLTITPSGGTQEFESMPIAASSGQTSALEDMTAYGVWGGNHQVEYRSSAVGNYITFDTYYDQWVESNFGDMTHSNTIVSGSQPALTVLSREDQNVTPAWLADTQTQESPADESISNQSVRVVIQGDQITRSGSMIRIKFMSASSAGTLTINSAYFGVRGAGPDFTGSPMPLYFDNAPIDVSDADGVGATANPGTNTGVTLSPGQHVWTNWFEYTIDASNPVADHLVSFNVSNGNGSSWTPSPATTTQSYRVNDALNAYAGLATWSTLVPSPSASDTLFAVAQVGSWIATGTATSQVYDTEVTSPNYGTLTWNQTLPAGASISIKVRSSSDASMSTAPDWSTVSAHTSTPSSLGSVSNQRYVQFQATLQAASPYASMPELDDVTIPWPGDTALVELDGTYTKRPNYGMFKVLVDGNETIQALRVALTATETYRGQDYDYALTAELKPRNTGK